MALLELIGVWAGASMLLLGVLAYCDWRTRREIRKRKIIREVNGYASRF